MLKGLKDKTKSSSPTAHSPSALWYRRCLLCQTAFRINRGCTSDEPAAELHGRRTTSMWRKHFWKVLKRESGLVNRTLVLT